MTTPRTRTPEKAAALKDALLAESTSPRKRRSLERLWAALETMRARGAKDYRLAAVAKELGEEGPKEQSLRNKEGEPYRHLIAAYAEEVAPPRRPAVGDADEELVLAIPDPALSARVAAVLAQNRALRRRNDILHEQFSKLTASAAEHAGASQPTASAQGGSAAAFTPDMARAVRTFLRDVPTFGWQVDEDSGAILDRHGGEVAPPYFVDALRAIMAAPNETADDDGRVASPRLLPRGG